MTDNPSRGAGGAGDQGQGPAPDRLWFPPSSDPGGYGQPGYQPGGYSQPGYQPGGNGQPGYQPGGYGRPGGNGQPPPWARQAHSQAPKPGIIPLRPIAVGEILDGAFTSIRMNPKATLGISAILLTISVIITTTISVMLMGSIVPLSPAQAANPVEVLRYLTHLLAVVLPPAIASALISFIVHVVLTGLLTAVVGRGVIGHRLTVTQAWQFVLSRLGALLGATGLLLLVLVVSWVPLVVILFALGVAGAPLGAVGAVFVFGLLATLCLEALLWTRFSLAAPAVVLERRGPAASLRRSWVLTRRSFWRVFLILLLTLIIVLVAGFVLQLPFSGLATLAPGLAGVVVAAIGSLASGTVTSPVAAGVTVLLYVDLRMRREGLDLVLASAGAGQAPDDGFASLWAASPVAGAPPGGVGNTAGQPPSSAGPPPAW